MLDEIQEQAEAISYYLFELGEAVTDGIVAQIAFGMGLGVKGKVVINGIPVDVEIAETIKITVVLENGTFDIRLKSGVSGSAVFSEITSIDAGSYLEHSIFDSACTCHINSSLNDFMTCPANVRQTEVSPSIGFSAGAYYIIGGEVGIGYDFEAFAKSENNVRERAF